MFPIIRSRAIVVTLLGLNGFYGWLLGHAT